MGVPGRAMSLNEMIEETQKEREGAFLVMQAAIRSEAVESFLGRLSARTLGVIAVDLKDGPSAPEAAQALEKHMEGRPGYDQGAFDQTVELILSEGITIRLVVS